MAREYDWTEDFKPLPYDTKEGAEVCLSKMVRQSGDCPNVCNKTQSGRCVPVLKGDPDPEDKTLRFNNSMTFDLYEQIGIIECERSGDILSNAYALYSDDSKNIIIPFRIGTIRRREVVLHFARFFFQSLLAFLFDQVKSGKLDDVNAIIMCGHSEGGVLAEALALLLMNHEPYYRTPPQYINDSFPDLRSVIDDVLKKVFLITTGTHLWMSREEMDLITNKLDSRYASFVTSNSDGAFDPYCLYNNSMPKPEEDDDEFTKRLYVSQMTSLPKINLLEDNSFVSLGSIDTESLRAQKRNALVQLQELHYWKTYESRFRNVFDTILLGGRKASSNVTLVICSAVVFFMSLLPR